MQLFSQPPRQSFSPTVIPDHVPVYRIKDGKFYADDELYDAGSIIAWEDEPNLEMEPMNALAVKEMKKYLEKLDVYGREVAAKNGKAYVSYGDAFRNSMELAKQEGKRVTLLNGMQETPILGGSRRGPKKASKIDLHPEPPAAGTTGKLSLSNNRAVVNSSETGL